MQIGHYLLSTNLSIWVLMIRPAQSACKLVTAELWLFLELMAPFMQAQAVIINHEQASLGQGCDS